VTGERIGDSVDRTGDWPGTGQESGGGQNRRLAGDATETGRMQNRRVTGQKNSLAGCRTGD
jgi:hypothetical protein